MPQDSGIISVTQPASGEKMNQIVDSLRWTDSVRHAGGQLMMNQDYQGPDLFTWSVIVALAFLAFLISFPIVSGKIRRRRIARQIALEMDLKGKELDITLSGQNSFYRDLSAEYRQRFLWRLLHFMSGKKFEYVGIEAADEIPVLVGAAAIQLTFGLRGYLMEFLDTIYLMHHDYYYGYFQTPFQGHVNSRGIYLSWINFMKGYENYSDAQNVGLHEMAHALAYVNFYGYGVEDEEFKHRFSLFSKIARPVFESMKSGTPYLFDSYAATDYNEFWAVSVETFFEKPQEFYQQLPEYYLAMCSLLNQDPMKKTPILIPAEAG